MAAALLCSNTFDPRCVLDIVFDVFSPHHLLLVLVVCIFFRHGFRRNTLVFAGDDNFVLDDQLFLEPSAQIVIAPIRRRTFCLALLVFELVCAHRPELYFIRCLLSGVGSM